MAIPVLSWLGWLARQVIRGAAPQHSWVMQTPSPHAHARGRSALTHRFVRTLRALPETYLTPSWVPCLRARCPGQVGYSVLLMVLLLPTPGFSAEAHINFYSPNAHAHITVAADAAGPAPICPSYVPTYFKYYAEIQACAHRQWEVDRQERSCSIASKPVGTQERSRQRPRYTQRYPEPPHASYTTYGPWEAWSTWSSCRFDCSPWPGFKYDEDFGACALRGTSRTQIESRPCTDPDDPSRQGTQQRLLRYTEYILRHPPNGQSEIRKVYVDESPAWGPCVVSQPDSSGKSPDTPTAPKVGAQFQMSGDLICSRQDKGFDYGKGLVIPASTVSNQVRTEIIEAYKKLPSQRCPEYGVGSFTESYPYWVNEVGQRLMGIGVPPLSEAQAIDWVRKAIKQAGSPETLNDMHIWCQQTANKRYGYGTVSARFITRGSPGYTGNTCHVTATH